jgi:hypothetical protein
VGNALDYAMHLRRVFALAGFAYRFKPEGLDKGSMLGVRGYGGTLERQYDLLAN